ncbi:hypothetical protein [Melittangium boletus]|uniref:Uncharacterized protein n=1 Tax=Melittangium boletus DSM 14713 TaxID=1294270 RepID=A0A250ISX4_9BACT|nr:hypothetical protein [Melittangium boletus]ATB34340.1 hypothetical protein MEBOL_007841 [Melittangium boletus DSM 14713]
MSATLTFDDSHWPLVILRITGVMTNGQFAQFLAGSTSVLARGGKYASITDVSQAGIPPLAQCRQLAEWMRQHEARMREHVLCNAIVAPSASLRLSMSLVFHLMPPPMPHIAVSDMASAVDFALARLVDAERGSDAARIRRHFAPPELHAD